MHSLLPRPWFLVAVGGSTLSRIMDSQAENQLLGSAARGDEDSFQRLRECYEPFLTRFISKRVSPTEIDDIAQETWIAIWTSLKSFHRGASFRAWASAICMRRIQDHWRRTNSRPRTFEWSEFEDKSSYLPTEFKALEIKDSLSVIWAALTPSQQELLTLYYGDELTLKEISAALNTNLNTIKYQFYRAHDVALEAMNGSEPSGKGKKRK